MYPTLYALIAVAFFIRHLSHLHEELQAPEEIPGGILTAFALAMAWPLVLGYEVVGRLKGGKG